MNQGKYILTAASLILTIIVIYLLFKKFSQKNSPQQNPVTIIVYDKGDDSLNIIQAEGKKLFQQSCASCHAIFKDLTGPALIGFEKRWPDRKKLYQFIRNPNSILRKDPYLLKLQKEFGTAHPRFPNLNNASIDAILNYINEESKKKLLPMP